MSLRNYDLNLLVILETLILEASVTRTAKRLNLTQSAISQALSRGREVFDDPLLVRDGARMALTPKAKELLPRLRTFCATAETLLMSSDFDPREAAKEFVILANDVSELVILPPVISSVVNQSPGSRVTIRSVEPSFIDHAVDLAIVGAPLPEGPYASLDLYEDHFVVLARHDHPHLRDTLTLETFARLSHALVSPTGRTTSGPIDNELRKHGLTRTISLSVTRFIGLPRVLSCTDLVAAVPSRFAALPEVSALCGTWPLPFESPRFHMRLFWHRSRDADPAHRWLRSLFVTG